MSEAQADFIAVVAYCIVALVFLTLALVGYVSDIRLKKRIKKDKHIIRTYVAKRSTESIRIQRIRKKYYKRWSKK